MSSRPTRRAVLAGSAAVAVAAAGGGLAWRRHQLSQQATEALPGGVPRIVSTHQRMPYRAFGATGLQVSEVGFGAWGIGGKSYGAVERGESLAALARAEELGCNFVDTAQVYGNSEEVLGEFLKERRSRWILSTKYSGQDKGLTATLEQQLRTLGTDAVDYYQLHWAPTGREAALYEELERVKRAGKARFVGVSLYTAADIDDVIDHRHIDGVMLAFSLLDPDPFLQRRERLRQSGLAVIVRSALKEGFLVGNFKRDATFPDPDDQRHSWSHERIAQTVDQVEQLRFLAAGQGSMVAAAARYPLSYPEVSTVLMGTTKLSHADSNFGQIPGERLQAGDLTRVAALQQALGLREPDTLVGRLLRRFTRR